MAIPHSQPGEVIDVRPLTNQLAGARTTALVKTESLELIRLIVPRDKEIPPHATRGAITVQCLEGRVAFTAAGVSRELSAGDMLYLEGEQSHSVKGIDDASLLLTITFPRDSPLVERAAAVGVNESSNLRGGGRVDFDSSTSMDRVDQASKESFPASDSPSYIHGDALELPSVKEAVELSKQRGGRVDFDSDDASDQLDEALQESFPASDPPSYT